MIYLRLTLAILMVTLSACSGQVGGMMMVPAANMRAVTGGVRAMPGGGVRAMPADGNTDTRDAAPSDPQSTPETNYGVSAVDLHSPMLP